MQGSKRARNTPSITNSGKIFGIMGGLAPRVGLSNAGTYNHQVIETIADLVREEVDKLLHNI